MNLKKIILLIVTVGVIGSIILFVSTTKEELQVCGVQNQVETVIKSDSTLIADTLMRNIITRKMKSHLM